MSEFPPIDELLPHSGAMVLLDSLLAWSPGYARCRLVIRPNAPFVRDGAVDSVVSIEYMAQAVAACLGYEALVSGGGVRVGMIIACKRFEAHADSLRVGDELELEVQSQQGDDTLSHFACKLTRAGSVFSEALLTLYHARELPLRARSA